MRPWRWNTGPAWASPALLILLGLMVIAASPAHADSTASGDAQVTGQVGVGTVVPQARTEVRMSASDNYALKVSSADGSSLFSVGSGGNVGVGMASPQAHLDVTGAGDAAGNIGLQLRVGDSSTTTLSSQVVFASTAGTYAHVLTTQHNSAANMGNSIEFLLWGSTGIASSVLGSSATLSLQAAPQGSTASVHILPVGTPVAELEVSNGLTTGGGTMHRASAGPHSSRELKSDVSYLDAAERKQAYEDVKSLRHARYRYKAVKPGSPAGKPVLVRNPSAPLMRGLIYEDAPASIQTANNRLVLDHRVLNLELALQETDGRIAALEAQIASLEAEKKLKRGKP